MAVCRKFEIQEIAKKKSPAFKIGKELSSSNH